MSSRFVQPTSLKKRLVSALKRITSRPRQPNQPYYFFPLVDTRSSARVLHSPPVTTTTLSLSCTDITPCTAPFHLPALLFFSFFYYHPDSIYPATGEPCHLPHHQQRPTHDLLLLCKQKPSPTNRATTQSHVHSKAAGRSRKKKKQNRQPEMPLLTINQILIDTHTTHSLRHLAAHPGLSNFDAPMDRCLSRPSSSPTARSHSRSTLHRNIDTTYATHIHPTNSN